MNETYALLYEIPGYAVLGSASGSVRLVEDHAFSSEEWQNRISDDVQVVRASVQGDVRTWSTNPYPHGHLVDMAPWKVWNEEVNFGGIRYSVAFLYKFGEPDTLWLLGDRAPLVAEIVAE